MSKRKKEQQREELSREELEEQNGEELPDREVMSTLSVPDIATIAPEPGLVPPETPPDDSIA
jgi:hypothetical protein